MIRLQFVLGPDVSSKAIAWFSSGNLSHVDAVLADGSLLGARSDHVGGQPPGVQIRPADYAAWPLKVRIEIRATQEQEVAYKRFLFSQINKPYDSSAIWGFAAGRDWRSPDSWFCSELQAAALEKACVFPTKLYLGANKITPVGLALAVTAAGGYEV